MLKKVYAETLYVLCLRARITKDMPTLKITKIANLKWIKRGSITIGSNYLYDERLLHLFLQDCIDIYKKHFCDN